ncbi:FixH family protein [Rhodopirellula maiorica SM1]|uniref:FixH family protein n=1 Tax=Rhodopirellula maiorica SM1 TaxID=1265738 RepID=M5RRP4_9BACT|nr:FixH family protein [Rhodopirellula maiorica]EMI18057.1 FixH family protein [Rhodopirellula maiorica SM1]
MTEKPTATNRVPEFDRVANRNAAIRWGGLVVGLLSLQVAVGVVAIMLATGDPSAAVLPDYYQKSLDWDEQRKSESVSQELGWNLTLVPIPGQQNATLQGVLTDADGKPVDIAAGTVDMYHYARAADVKTIPIAANDSGVIVSEDCFTADGLWQIEIDVTDDQGQRFVHSQDLLVTQTQHRLTKGN